MPSGRRAEEGGDRGAVADEEVAADEERAAHASGSGGTPSPAEDEDALQEAAQAQADVVIFGDVCAICQEDVARRGRLDSCAHLFCVPCIRKWAKIETRCPLCKARFTFIQPEDLVVVSAIGGNALCDPADDADARDGGSGRRATRGGKKPALLKRIYLPHRDQVYENPDGGELPDGVDLEEVLCGRCGDGGMAVSRRVMFSRFFCCWGACVMLECVRIVCELQPLLN